MPGEALPPSSHEGPGGGVTLGEVTDHWWLGIDPEWADEPPCEQLLLFIDLAGWQANWKQVRGVVLLRSPSVKT